VLFHKRVCGPLANTLSDRQKTATATAPTAATIEAAYHRADAAIQSLIDLVAA
jgi:hypothetical protein